VPVAACPPVPEHVTLNGPTRTHEAKRFLNILQVNQYDVYGGAERIASNLTEAYRRRGHDARLAVGRKRSNDPRVLSINNSSSAGPWSGFWWWLHETLQPWYGRSSAIQALCRATHALASPRGWRDTRRGIEDFHYPGTRRLLNLPPRRPDILHAHNLHGRYFDLRELARLSGQVPVVLTLHDAWLLSGHCAHSFDCERWKTGCGACPDLTIYPAIRHDRTAENWRRKRDIYARARLHVATPSRWLMRKVEQSMLGAHAVECRVIPNGVDRGVFRPSDRAAARRRLDLPQEATVLLFTASGIRANPWKDYGTLREAVGRVAQGARPSRPLFLGLGEDAPPERIGPAELRFAPFDGNPANVARYYQAADLYIHAARADTFPNTVLEAVACGIPVVATAVGGIPEQLVTESADRATGVLTPPGNARALAEAIERLLADDAMRRGMSERAASDARDRFDLERQADAYLAWYRALCDRHQEK
jgi:glycosyltransferase involved in cell wall biosynthesis